MEKTSFKVILTTSARLDLLEMVGYWEDAGEPERAEKYARDLTRAAHTLEVPRVAFGGKFLSDSETPDVREIRVFRRTYRIIYQVNESAGEVEILRFWHSRRDEPGV